MGRPGLTRRHALALAAASLAARVPAAAAAEIEGEAELLRRAVRLEQTGAYVYVAAATSGLLGAFGATAFTFASHEDQQADAVGVALDATGAQRPPRPGDDEAADEELEAIGIGRRLGYAVGRRGLLELMREIEEATLAHYVSAQAAFHDVRLVQTVATLVGATAQHLVVLRRELGDDPIPRAFDPRPGGRLP